MDQTVAVQLLQQAIGVAIILALPAMVATFITGLLITIVEAVTGVQEATLTFLPKTVVLAVTYMVFGGTQLDRIVQYGQDIFRLMPTLVR